MGGPLDRRRADLRAEEPAWDRPTGASAGLATSALADADGTLYLLYRAAVDDVGRDMYLLTSRDRAQDSGGRRSTRGRPTPAR